jgi:hypothetical protein
MDQPFEKKLKAAVGTGWLVFLIVLVAHIGQLFACHQMMQTKPGWILDLMGPDISWDDVKWVTLLYLTLWRTTAGILVLVLLWLTLWSRKLNR